MVCQPEIIDLSKTELVEEEFTSIIHVTEDPALMGSEVETPFVKKGIISQMWILSGMIGPLLMGLFAAGGGMTHAILDAFDEPELLSIIYSAIF